jgi:hypothetical protein
VVTARVLRLGLDEGEENESLISWVWVRILRQRAMGRVSEKPQDADLDEIAGCVAEM